MATQFIEKKANANQVLDLPGAAGVAVVGGALYVHDGTAARKLTSTQDLPVAGLAAGQKIARGRRTLLSALDTVVTGLATVAAVTVSLESDPTLTCKDVSGSIGNQAGAPAAGSIYIKAWMPTDATHPAPIAATGFAGMVVNWTAIGS